MEARVRVGVVNHGVLTFKLAFVPLIPRPMTSPPCTKTQPTGVSSEARASSAIWMACRMKCSWYSRLGMGGKTILVDSLDRGLRMWWCSFSQEALGLVGSGVGSFQSVVRS